MPEPEDTGSIKALIDGLNHHLLMAHAEGRRTVLVVDEAQNLARDVLEQVRLLTNLETSKQKLLQIILIGQPELRELLARNDLRQLAQRITGRYHLEPLSRGETARYIEHRLRVAGALGEVFDAGAKKEVFKLSQGVPRLINVICDRALLGAYSREARRVNRRLIRVAAAEISGKTWTPTWLRWATPLLVTTGLGLVAFGTWSILAERQAGATEPPALVAPAPAPVVEPEIDDTPAVAAATSEVEVAAIEEPPEQSLDEQLMLATGLTDSTSALSALLEIWQLPESTPASCEALGDAGYECLAQRGSWNSLRQLDRPAILTLTDSAGDTHRAVLTAIQGDRAVLSIGGVSVTHSIDDVSELWFGQFLLIWKPANGQSVALGPGVRDRNVVWLRKSLATIDERYRADPVESDVYDQALTDRVREFQRDHRLLVDGLAGRQTQIIINSLVAVDDVPRLTTPRLARD